MDAGDAVTVGIGMQACLPKSLTFGMAGDVNRNTRRTISHKSRHRLHALRHIAETAWRL